MNEMNISPKLVDKLGQPLLGGFAELVSVNPAEHDAVEVSPVTTWKADGDIVCETCNEANAHFWSAYAHRIDGGVECIGDFPAEEQAKAYAFGIAKQHGLRVDIL